MGASAATPLEARDSLGDAVRRCAFAVWFFRRIGLGQAWLDDSCLKGMERKDRANVMIDIYIYSPLSLHHDINHYHDHHHDHAMTTRTSFETRISLYNVAVSLKAEKLQTIKCVAWR